MPIVTLTTDFGFRDGYAGAMKGVVLTLAPAATIVDVTHGVPPQDVVAGAVALAQAAPLYPPGTIHVAVVDPGVGSARAGVLVEAGEGPRASYFVGPDNGVLTLAARAPRRVWRIEAPAFRREPVSPTFHGRDVFAPTAGRLAAGARPDEAGPRVDTLVELGRPAIERRGGQIEGTVIHVDAFGNLITSLTGDHVPEGAAIEVEGAGGVFHPVLARTFSDVPEGALVAYLGSGGQLEIARRNGSAAAHLGAERGALVRAGAGA
jgi:S-adenosyl-L-methionine hydrolase (adenosine-forming)